MDGRTAAARQRAELGPDTVPAKTAYDRAEALTEGGLAGIRLDCVRLAISAGRDPGNVAQIVVDAGLIASFVLGGELPN